MRGVDACSVNIPHKYWATDPREAANYEAIEQWSYRVPGCITTPVPPVTPITVHRIRGNVSNSFPNDGVRRNIDMSPSSGAQFTFILGTAFALDTPDNPGRLRMNVNGLYMYWAEFVFVATVQARGTTAVEAGVAFTSQEGPPASSYAFNLGGVDRRDGYNSGASTIMAFGGGGYIRASDYTFNLPSFQLSAGQNVVPGSNTSVTVNFCISCMETP